MAHSRTALGSARRCTLIARVCLQPGPRRPAFSEGASPFRAEDVFYRVSRPANDVERFCQGPPPPRDMGASGRAEPEVRRITALDRRRGPRVNTAAPAARRARTNGVDVGVEAATRSPRDSGWRAIAKCSTTRRSAVDRRTATMMFASRNRSKAIRRWLPLNRGAHGALGLRTSGRNAGEDRICCGGAPARRGGLGHERRRSRRDRRDDHAQASATISAHRKPASSRATAAATTERTFLCAAS